MYQRVAPNTSFQQLFWIWSTLFGSLREVLASPLPKARLYHTISTGYAGLLAARAKAETGAPMLLTEHGLYTHERFVELMSSDDLHDCFKYAPLHSSDRREGRDVWLEAFESMASICYAQADKTITLSEMKNGLTRTFPVADVLIEALKALPHREGYRPHLRNRQRSCR